jgi:hypothetical protein
MVSTSFRWGREARKQSDSSVAFALMAILIERSSSSLKRSARRWRSGPGQCPSIV